MKRFTAIILALLLMLPIICVSNAADLAFEDVLSGDWFYEDVHTVCEIGLMEGRSSLVFAPRAVTTRAEFVTLASCIADADTTDMGKIAAKRFTDVGADSWYAPYIGWASENSLVNGYSDNTFRPDAPISRQELAILIVRFLGQQKVDLSSDHSIIDRFEDAGDFPSWSRSDIEKLRLIGIVGGDENGCFNHEKPATRAEIATVTRRIVDFCCGYRDSIIDSLGTLEYRIAYDGTVTAEALESWLLISTDPDSHFDRVAATEPDKFISDVGAVMPGESNTVTITAEFSIGMYSRKAEISVRIVREAAPCVLENDPTPENIGTLYSDEATGIKISYTVPFATDNGSITSTGTGIHGGHESKLLRTEYGTFAVYLTGEHNDASYGFVWDEFKVLKITSVGTEVVMSGEYPHSNGSCLPNIFAGENGRIYVSVISVDNPKYYTQNHKEGAWLNIYEIDAESGRWEVYSGNPDFEIMGVHGYGYSQPIPDIANGKIYALYTGGGVPGYLAWFVYDISSHSWSDECFTVRTDYRCAYFNAYADGKGGFYFVGQRDVLAQDLASKLGVPLRGTGYVWDALYIFRVADPTVEAYTVQTVREPQYDPTKEQNPQGMNHYGDGCTYLDTDGRLHILYTHAIKSKTYMYHAVYAPDGREIMNDQLTLSGTRNRFALAMAQGSDGKYYILATNSYATVKTAALEIWCSDDGLDFGSEPVVSPVVFSTAGDDPTTFEASGFRYFVTGPRNNSLSDGVIGMMFFDGKDGTYNYYYCSVRLP